MNNKLIIALDNLSLEKVIRIIEESSKSQNSKDIIYKFNDLIPIIWLKWIESLVKDYDIDIMLDLKWYDISNTMCNYLRQISKLSIKDKIKLITIHTSSWSKALKDFIKTRNELWLNSKILAITALTSFSDEDTLEIFDEVSKHSVLKLAKTALNAWVDWLVCSPLEASLLRYVFSEQEFIIVTPWVRFANNNVKSDDQTRIMTPEMAIEHWSNGIVMWRPILLSENKQQTIDDILQSIKDVKYKEMENKNPFMKLSYVWSWEDILKYIWALYRRPDWWKYCRIASTLLTDAYINIWTIERNYIVVEKATTEMAYKIKEKNIKADIVMWAQMWSVRLSLYLAEKLWIEESIYMEKTWKDNDTMELKRHSIDITWKKIVISEDIVTKWSTLKKMIEWVDKLWWEVVAVACVWNRYKKDNFNWIPLLSCFVPPDFGIYYDENTLFDARKDYPELPKWSKVSEKPKNDWTQLVNDMRKSY